MLVAAISDHFKLNWIQINFTKKEKIYMVKIRILILSILKISIM